MSSDFYFRKWKTTLARLEDLVQMDVHYQTTKANDKKRCDAALRLSAVLGQYMTIYNQIMECLHHNLQIQKTGYIEETVKAVVARILELNHELRKLDASEHQFQNNGLILNFLTTNDAELTEIPSIVERPEQIQRMIEEVIKRANEKKRHIEERKLLEERGIEEEQVDNWWDVDNKTDESEGEDDYILVNKKEELSQEQKEIKRNIEIIQACEKTRQVIAWRTHHFNRRQRWEKDIEGTSTLQAPYEIRQRSAAIIQKVCRAYFKCKRQRYLDCKRDELLGLRQCKKLNKDAQEKFAQLKAEKLQLKEKFKEDLKSEYESIKNKYLKWKGDEICESYRDHIRDWFHVWFEQIKLFHEIPDDKTGGSKLILKEDLPTPEEYLEEYKAYMVEKKTNKNKSGQQLKYEKMEAKHQQSMDKREDLQKKKLEKDMKRKMMKNPTLHPGFNYPESKKTAHILTVIGDYHSDWNEFDETEQLEVKKRHCTEVARNKAMKEVKMEVIQKVDEDMRIELHELQAALKKDYITNEEEMPEPMKKRKRREKKKRPVKTTLSESLTDKLEELVFRGFIKEYPKTKLEDFIGDPNFVGDDIRCNYKSAYQLHGDTRSVWWERCRDMTHGFRRILLVGPRGGGKTILLHALASLNDAILFELDPNEIRSELASDVYLEQIVKDVVTCAKAAQPSVIHVKHVHRFFYKKVPPEEAELNLELFKRHFMIKLFKKIHKTDKITVIGTCIDPWMTKSKQMLKKFPNVVLLPNTNYSTVVQMLNEWMLSYHAIPADFNVSCLAHVLQGYSYGYLKDFLERFISPERIAQISIHGLSPKEVYDSILEEGVEKIDYPKYLNWYTDRTAWGQKEKHHLEEQNEFKQALEKWALKMEIEKRKAARAAPSKT